MCVWKKAYIFSISKHTKRDILKLKKKKLSSAYSIIAFCFFLLILEPKEYFNSITFELIYATIHLNNEHSFMDYKLKLIPHDGHWYGCNVKYLFLKKIAILVFCSKYLIVMSSFVFGQLWPFRWETWIYLKFYSIDCFEVCWGKFA